MRCIFAVLLFACTSAAHAQARDFVEVGAIGGWDGTIRVFRAAPQDSMVRLVLEPHEHGADRTLTLRLSQTSAVAFARRLLPFARVPVFDAEPDSPTTHAADGGTLLVIDVERDGVRALEVTGVHPRAGTQTIQISRAGGERLARLLDSAVQPASTSATRP